MRFSLSFVLFALQAGVLALPIPVNLTKSQKRSETQLSTRDAPSSSLFPVPDTTPVKYWTTSSAIEGALPLNNDLFRSTQDDAKLKHDIDNAPDGQLAMKAAYPQGFNFSAPGPADVDLTTAKEVSFSYSILFPKGFDFESAGELPGIYGGNIDGQCPVGVPQDACFTSRLMFRQGGEGELYTQLPTHYSTNQNLCIAKGTDAAKPGVSSCKKNHSSSVGRGSFSFPTNEWTTVTQRIKLNDINQENGEIELYINGQSVIEVKQKPNASGLLINGLVFRDETGEGRIRGLQMLALGGDRQADVKDSRPVPRALGSTKKQEVFFRDFSVAILTTL